MCKRILEVEIIHGIAIVVEPAIERLNGKAYPVAGSSPIAFAQAKFRLRKGCFEAFFVDTFFCIFAAAVFNKLAEAFAYAFLCTFELEHELRLETCIDKRCIHVFAKACFEHRFLQGAFIRCA